MTIAIDPLARRLANAVAEYLREQWIGERAHLMRYATEQAIAHGARGRDHARCRRRCQPRGTQLFQHSRGKRSGSLKTVEYLMILAQIEAFGKRGTI